MADQDFKINIVTLADLTGIKLTQQQLTALQTAAKQGNQQAIDALKKLSAAQKEAASSMGAGFGGSAVGVGTIVTLLTGAIAKWKQFNDEQDKIIDKMLEATAKMREEALAVAAIKDLDFSEELIKQAKSADELVGNYTRLTQKIAALKAAQDALDPFSQAKEWKDLRTEINAYESQLKSLQSTLQQKGITDLTPKTPGPKAGIGESQSLVDEIERNRKAAEDQLKEDVWEVDPTTGGYRLSGAKQFPIFQPPPPPANTANPNQYPSPIGPPMAGIKDMIKQAFDEAMSRYWGP